MKVTKVLFLFLPDYNPILEVTQRSGIKEVLDRTSQNRVTEY